MMCTRPPPFAMYPTSFDTTRPLGQYATPKVSWCRKPSVDTTPRPHPASGTNTPAPAAVCDTPGRRGSVG
eukprot:16186-Eustigmatos_ZCMA.PRE.1